MKKKIYIVVPAYNEGLVIKNVLKGIKKEGFNDIIVTSDGSNDNTYDEASSVKDVICLKHTINRGKGAATITGIEAAKRLKADVIVTMDGDGQHDPKDIKKIVKPILENKVDVVLSNRLANEKNLPFIKIILNKIGNLVTWFLFGIKVSDSQSGFRSYNKKAAKVIDIKGDDYEYESEGIREIKRNKLKYKEVPINVFYTKYSQESKAKGKRQNIFNGFKTGWKLIRNSLK